MALYKVNRAKTGMSTCHMLAEEVVNVLILDRESTITCFFNNVKLEL